MTSISSAEAADFGPARAAARPRSRAWIGFAIAALVVFVGVPLLANDYWLNAILVPFLILSLAGLGLNLLMGYAGQASLGTGGFMSVGAYATYNLLLRLPELPLPVSLLLGGVVAGLVGTAAGLLSLRIKGFILSPRHLRRSSFLSGSSISSAGSRIIRRPARYPHRVSPSLATTSLVLSAAIFSLCPRSRS